MSPSSERARVTANVLPSPARRRRDGGRSSRDARIGQQQNLFAEDLLVAQPWLALPAVTDHVSEHIPGSRIKDTCVRNGPMWNSDRVTSSMSRRGADCTWVVTDSDFCLNSGLKRGRLQISNDKLTFQVIYYALILALMCRWVQQNQRV